MQLYATPLSHFSRKVRILLDAHQHPYELVDVGNVGDSRAFGGNPLMQVPALVDGEQTLFDSDLIAAHLVRSRFPEDRFRVCTQDPLALQMRAALNGVMAREVQLILAQRSGLHTAGVPYFEKIHASLLAGLLWLEERSAHLRPQQPGYLEFHTVCALEHLQRYALVAEAPPGLSRLAEEVGALPYVRQSSPL